MPPKSKSNRGKRKIVPKSKQQWRVKNPTRNWLELASDLMVNILQRVGVVDILEKTQKVCTAWREICKEPAIWRVIYKHNALRDPLEKTELQETCKHAVHRSQGQLLDLTLIDVCDDELLQYVAVRSSQLRRLEVVYYFGNILSEALKKFSLLEELSLVRTNISQEDIEAIGCYCLLLKTLKVNQKANHLQNEIALAIGKNLPELTHLQLIGNNMKNTELQAILDGGCHLESLDLRGCVNLDLNVDLGKRCSQEIKYLKLPHHSLEGYPYAYVDEYDGYYHYDDECEVYYHYDDQCEVYYHYDDEHDGYFDYGDYSAYDYDEHDGSYD